GGLHARFLLPQDRDDLLFAELRSLHLPVLLLGRTLSSDGGKIGGHSTPNGLVKLQAVKLGKSWTIKDEWLAVFELRVRPEPGRPDLDLE
ncbi:MAG: hypothetical protein ACX938_13135, partial [Roseivivax sp.]